MTDIVKLNNLNIIYDYANSSVGDALTSLNSLNTRLATVTGACGLLLRFAAEVPYDVLRFLISLSLLLCVGFCGFGLFAKASGNLASIGTLMDEWYYEPDEQCKLFILNNWRETLKQVDAKRFYKACCLNWAFCCLGFAFVLLANAVVVGIVL